jgi:apolipoprotein N-acyltransferase
VQRTAEFTAAGMVVSMPLRSALTPAVRVAPWLERCLTLLAIGCLVAAVATRRRIRSVPAAPTAEMTAVPEPQEESVP